METLDPHANPSLQPTTGLTPTNDLCLIAHRVRGEPAFDIAQKILIGDEEGWIIPTSGHRAYPYWYQPLNRLFIHPRSGFAVTIYEVVINLPYDWPDHYEATAAPKGQGTLTASDIATALGLRKPAVVINRRI